MKKVVILLLLVLCACAAKPEPEDECGKTGGCEIDPGENTDIVPEDLKWEVMSVDQAYEFIEGKGSGVLFFSFVDCPWCKAATPILEEVSEMYVDKVTTYYVNVQRSERETGQETYDKIYEVFRDYIEERGEDKMYVPTFVWLKEGAVTDYWVGTIDDQVDMSEEQKAQLKTELNVRYQNLVENPQPAPGDPSTALGA